jgi:type IV pilus biogenesis protein PilP
MSSLNNLLSRMETLKSKKALMICMACLLLAALGFTLWEYFADADASALPLPPQTTSEGPDPARPDTPQGMADASPHDAGNPLVSEPQALRLGDVSRSRQLADLLSERQLKEAELAVRELEAKIAAVAKPAQSVPVLPVAPDLRSQPEIAPRTPMQPQEAQLPAVRAIRGLNGKFKAVLTLNGAVRTLRVGETWKNGVVENISLSGVRFRKGGVVYTLAFEE